MRIFSFFICVLLYGIDSAAQELVGADRVLPGTLASFEITPAQEASWHIVSPSVSAETFQSETFQVDTGASKLYFASPDKGRYTVIAGIVVTGKPQLLVKTFWNGEEDGRVVPTPMPPPPASSLKSWVKTQAPILVKSQNIAAESRLIADCFEKIAQRIDGNAIKTAQNARTQLQIALMEALALASPTAVTDWAPFLSELSRQLERELGQNVDDLTEVNNVLKNTIDAMLSVESPEVILTPLQNITTPVCRGTPKRMFRNLLTK